ncbi:MAG: SGNH/GDSL hydrolase family protein [Pseudomonadota bacterium]
MRLALYRSGLLMLLIGLALSACRNDEYSHPVSAGKPTQQGAKDTSFRYVALGDGFTSGPFIPVQSLSPPAPGCMRSDRNYPSLLAGAIQSKQFIDVSCYGANTTNLTEKQEAMGAPVGGVNPPQLDALTKDVNLVTIGMMGPGLDFAGIAIDCGMSSIADSTGSPCRSKKVVDGKDPVLATAIAGAQAIGPAVEAIRKRAPNARILVVGYAALLPENTGGQTGAPRCWPLLPFADGDVAWLSSVVRAINTTLAETAAAHGAEYVDIYSSSIGHDACQLPGIKWTEGALQTCSCSHLAYNELGMQNAALQVLNKLEWKGQRPAWIPLP